MATTRRKANDLATNEQLAQLVAINQTLSRLEFASALGYTHNGARNLYEVCGYKPTLSFEDYWHKYKRGLGSKIVNMPADATWRTPPQVYEGDEASETQFEKDWNELCKRLRVYHYINRVDRLAGLGYAVLLIGVKGEKNLSEPLQKLTGPQDVIYLAPYSQKSAVIHSWDLQTRNNPHFGKPLSYRIDLAGILQTEGISSSAPKLSDQQIVHYTRVLHVSDGLLEDDVFGTPRLEPVFNHLEDLEKVVGGSAEMFWLGARQGLVFKNREGADLPLVGEQAEAMKEYIDQYIHKLSRMMRLNNVDVEALSSPTPDPSGNVDKILDIISGITGIPKRILTGAERGELASSQDETNWNARITERQKNYAEQLVLRELINRLVAVNALAAPKGEYTVEWPNLFEMSESEKADIGVKKSQSIAAYNNSPGADMLVPPSEFRREVLHLSDQPDPKDMASIMEPEEEEEPEAVEQFEQGRRAA